MLVLVLALVALAQVLVLVQVAGVSRRVAVVVQVLGQDALSRMCRS